MNNTNNIIRLDIPDTSESSSENPSNKNMEYIKVLNRMENNTNNIIRLDIPDTSDTSSVSSIYSSETSSESPSNKNLEYIKVLNRMKNNPKFNDYKPLLPFIEDILHRRFNYNDSDDSDDSDSDSDSECSESSEIDLGIPKIMLDKPETIYIIQANNMDKKLLNTMTKYYLFVYKYVTKPDPDNYYKNMVGNLHNKIFYMTGGKGSGRGGGKKRKNKSRKRKSRKSKSGKHRKKRDGKRSKRGSKRSEFKFESLENILNYRKKIYNKIDNIRKRKRIISDNVQKHGLGKTNEELKEIEKDVIEAKDLTTSAYQAAMLADGSQSRLNIARKNLEETAKAVTATVAETRKLSEDTDTFSREINTRAGQMRTEILAKISADNTDALRKLVEVSAGPPSTGYTK
jgi:hypothetical protein